MEYSRLPHWQKREAAYFVTWRLYGSLPVNRVADRRTTDGARFAAADRLPDASATGPGWLQKRQVAECVIQVLRYAESQGLYELGSWVLMLNHVHLILRPHIDLARLIAILKARSARNSNELLDRASFDTSSKIPLKPDFV